MTAQCARCGTRVSEGRLQACPSCLLEPVRLGESIELLEEIGRGGMGTVYKARHNRLGRHVAVKVLPPELANRPEFETRFQREARALAMLSHPNIVSVFDSGRDGDMSYIVMELVEGRPLSALVPVDIPRAIDLARQISGALAFAHGRGIVHRDIKPENILVDPSGCVKVADFGVARLVDSPGWTVTRTDQALGTPHYMAPEALAGASPDPRMDVYSLGVLMYQMVTGKLPVGNYTPPPAPLGRVILKAMAQDPAQRYADAESLARDLESISFHPSGDDLDVDERMWVRAVAMLQSISTAVALWALLMSITPKVMDRSEVLPLIMIGQKDLGDGKVYSRARFEMWWTVAALATFMVAITGYALLRRHWRLAGLERVDPARPIPESKVVLGWGIVSVLVYGVRKGLEGLGWTGVAEYLPVVGAFIEVGALYYLWVAILLAWRISRPITREYVMWLGFWMAVLPPFVEMMIFFNR